MVRFRHNRKTDTNYPAVRPAGTRLVDVITTAEDRKIWDGIQKYQGRTVDELDQYLRSYGYRLSARGYVEGGPDKGRGGELWVSKTGFPIKAETLDGVVVKIQRKVA